MCCYLVQPAAAEQHAPRVAAYLLLPGELPVCRTGALAHATDDSTVLSAAGELAGQIQQAVRGAEQCILKGLTSCAPTAAGRQQGSPHLKTGP